jgi:hypothetical protein
MVSRVRRSLAIAVSVSTLFMGYAQAAPTDTAVWANLREAQAGQKIHVLQKDHTSWNGGFIAFADESVSLKTSAGDKTIARTDVAQVTGRGGRRLHHALIGAAIGGVAGVGVGAATGGCNEGGYGPCISRGGLGVIMGALGAVIGFAIGAVLPDNTVIYRAAVR